MKRINIDKKLHKGIYDVSMFLLFFSIVKIYAIPQVVQQGIKILSIGLVFFYFFCNSIQSLFNRVILLPCSMLVSSIIYYVSGESSDFRLLLEGVLNALCYWMISTCVYYSVKNNNLNRLLNFYYYLALICCGISLFSVFCHINDVRNYGANVIYFFGNKYSTCYLFIFFIGLAYYKLYDIKRKKLKSQWLLFFYIIVAILVSYFSKCYTALVALFFMIFLVLFSECKVKRIRCIFDNPISAVIFVVLPGIIALNIVLIMQNSFVSNIVTNWFGKSPSLTGRTYIYSKLFSIFSQKPAWGYGYNSGIVDKITAVGNAQNGIMELLIDYGICGVSIVLVIIFSAFRKHNKAEFTGFKIVFFTFCICSIVEISLHFLFFFVVFLLYFAKRDKEVRV